MDVKFIAICRKIFLFSLYFVNNVEGWFGYSKLNDLFVI